MQFDEVEDGGALLNDIRLVRVDEELSKGSTHSFVGSILNAGTNVLRDSVSKFSVLERESTHLL